MLMILLFRKETLAAEDLMNVPVNPNALMHSISKKTDLPERLNESGA